MEAKALAQQIPESTNVMSAQAVSLTRYLLGHEAKNPELGSEFCHFMAQLAFAAKIMAHQVMRAGLVGKLGLTVREMPAATHRRCWMSSPMTP
jgi:hypothetical protein